MSYVPSRRHTLRALKSSTALFSSVLVVTGLTTNISASAQDLPTGGSVAAGSATISQTAPNAMVINQTSATAVTNWQSFSIGQGNSVAVVQPSTSSAMLARVTGGTTSTIAGSLSATGQFMLVNPNGISITATGTVNAGGGFVATTLGISDDDFLSGKRSFKGNGASASVANDGAISVGPGGYAALIGGTVSNSGTISVPMGKVGLGSGEIATLDFSGDGFLQVGMPTSASGKGALVSNAGKITANGGSVHIKAAQARDAARQAINMSGVIEARSVSGSNGNITLGGSDGEVAVTGKLDVSSATGKGGSVRVTGRQIKLSGATIDASGKTGGGTVRIGGDRQGTGTLPRAAKVTVDKTTIIRADATDKGNGGDVVIWSDSRTDFAGTITARGGANGGNGGEAEVSSKGVLGYSGLTVLTAAKGTTGTLLLDPYNITISNAADTGGFTASADDSVINVTTLQTALANANVTISTGASGSQAGDITVAAPLAWSANILQLDAAHSIKFAATVTVGGTGALVLNTNVGGGSGGTIDFGLTSSGFAGRIDFTGTPGGQALLVNGAMYTLVYSLADLQNINNGLSGRYALAASLDLSGQTYTDALVGQASNTSFTGILDGLGHTVSNLTVNKSGDYAGLFGYSNGATIRNIGTVGGSVTGNSYTGGLVGSLSGNGTVSNAYATGEINGSLYTGGLVGMADGSSISNAHATGAVRGNINVGGLVGGIGYSSITNSHATGTVSGLDNLGGLIGSSERGVISNVYATGAVSGNSDNHGGLVGYIYQTGISNAYATGAVSGNNYIGGLVGYMLQTSTISNSYATGAVSASNSGGGLVGLADGATISSSYAAGAVSGSNYVGGLVGASSSATIAHAYATGAVSSSGSNVGGLVGYLMSGGTVSNAYWDKQTSGHGNAIGTGDNNQLTNVVGLTTAQFQNASSASGIGSAFTVSANLYPYLTSFFPNGVTAISGIAYKDAGRTVLASGSHGAGLVNVRVGNGAVQTVSTGANGYYYALLPFGAIDTTNGTNILAYTITDANSGAQDASAFRTAATGTLSSVDLSGGWRRDTTALANLSTLDAAYSAATAGTSAAGLTLTSRSIFAVSDFSLDRVLSLTGTLNLSSAGNVTQTAAFSAGTLILQGGGNTFTLTNAGNRFGQFAASGGAMNIYDASDLTIVASATDACNCTVSGVTGDGIGIATAGNLTIASGASVAGDSPVLAMGGVFVNNAGASAVTANTGRWLVYAAGPTGNMFGGLDSHNTAVWGTSYPTAVTAQGNRYVFAQQVTLTVTALDAEKSFGETSGFNGFTVSGFPNGIAGAFLGDVPANLTGSPFLSSAGAAANAASGTYDIAIARGSLASSGNGYGFSFLGGKLTVKGALTRPDGSFGPTPADFVPDPTNAFALSLPGGSRKGFDAANPANFSSPGYDSAIVCFPGRVCE